MTSNPDDKGRVLVLMRNGEALTMKDLAVLGIHPEDVDESWMDETMKRLFHEIRKQLSQLEAAKRANDGIEEAQLRMVNARVINSLERTLERLVNLEQRRVLNHETKVIDADDDALAELERRIDRLAAEARAQSDSAGPES